MAFTASVVGLGDSTPTSFVNFLDNGTQIGSVLLNESAQAMFMTSTLTIGPSDHRAIYRRLDLRSQQVDGGEPGGQHR